MRAPNTAFSGRSRHRYLPFSLESESLPYWLPELLDRSEVILDKSENYADFLFKMPICSEA